MAALVAEEFSHGGASSSQAQTVHQENAVDTFC